MPPRTLTTTLALAFIALASCGDDGPTAQDGPPARARARWLPIPSIRAPSLDEMLHRTDAPAQTLSLGAPPLDVYSELDRVIAYASNGEVTIFADRDGTVSATKLWALPTTCRPEDVAIDGRGNACALLRCVMTAACTREGARGWTETFELHDADGLASGAGAIIAWRNTGQGATRQSAGGSGQAEKGTPGVELIASGDGGRTFGRLGATATREDIVAAIVTAGPEVVYVTVEGATMMVRRGLPGEGHGGSFASARRVSTELTQLVAANGLVGVATVRGHELDFSWASPTTARARLEHTIELGAAPSAVAAWDDHTLLAGVGRDLVGLDLVDGRWSRSIGRIPEAPAPVPAIVGIGRAGAAIVVVLANGTVLVYR